MTRPSNILRSVAAVGLIMTMFAALSVTGSAQVVVNPDTYPDFFTSDVNECYFASVSNGEDFGLGASMTSITVQNLDDNDANDDGVSEGDGVVYIWVGSDSGFDEATFASLGSGASKTFTAADLGVPEGTTAPVIVAGYNFTSSQAGEFTPEDGITIGCVAKQAVAGESLPYTTAADTSVSGYNATSGREVGFFDQLYLPIVQTNCGPGGCWNTILRVANVGPFDNAAVTVRFFPADNASGSLATGFQLEGLLNQGELWSIDLSQWVPEGWVGSAQIFTDDNVVAIADRYKAGTDMWITNTAANATAETDLQVPGGPTDAPYVLYAPDVRMDFNGWNTGISVANTADADNNVNIQYFGNNGNAPQAQSQRIAAQGMTYFYNPSNPSEDDCEQPADQVPTCDFVGGAVILSEAPVAVAVDGVKYFGNDANVGQAFSYSATGNVFQFQAAPLVQKGSPATGMGATSGITFLNPNAGATFITVDWVNPSGFGASNFGDSIVWVPGYSTGFVYTMTQVNLPNGFTGSALVSSDLPIAASSANVDYQVQGDGTAIWTLYNPCGLYRQLGDCTFVPAPEPLATKTFDIRPAGVDALICVFDSVTGQDGKPIAPSTDCALQSVGEKGAGGGGQDELQTFFSLDEEGFAAVELTFDANNNDITADVAGMDEAGLDISLFNFSTVNSDGVEVPTGANATCDARGNNETPLDGAIGGDEIVALGDLTNAVVVVTDTVTGEEIFCGQLEEGTVRLETPEEAQARLGTVVPPFTVDANGEASVDLAAGCYFFVVSAEGFETFTSIEECLEPGETLANVIDLVGVDGGDTGILEKTFVDSDGDPITNIDVTVTPAGGGAALELGAPNSEGFLRTELSAGDYTLSWDTLTGIVPGDPAGEDPITGDPITEDVFLNGSEEFTIVEGETTVLTNTLQPLSVADVCVSAAFGFALGFPVEGVEVTVLDAATLAVIGVGFTDEDGQVDFYVEPGTYIFSAEGGLYVDPATGNTVPLADTTVVETIAAGDPNEGFLECDVETAMLAMTDGEAGFFTVPVELDGAAAEGVVVGLFGTRTNSAGVTVCDSTSLIGFGTTDAAGEVTFSVEGDQQYCIQLTDIAGNPIGEGTIVTIPVGTTTGDVIEIGAGGGATPLVGTIDVTLTATCADGTCDTETFFVDLHEADPALDTATSCGGAFITSVNGLVATDTASVVLAGGATDYCVDAGSETDFLADAASTGLTVTAGASTAVALTVAEP